jgi:hypothetical protein
MLHFLLLGEESAGMNRMGGIGWDGIGWTGSNGLLLGSHGRDDGMDDGYG